MINKVVSLFRDDIKRLLADYKGHKAMDYRRSIARQSVALFVCDPNDPHRSYTDVKDRVKNEIEKLDVSPGLPERALTNLLADIYRCTVIEMFPDEIILLDEGGKPARECLKSRDVAEAAKQIKRRHYISDDRTYNTPLSATQIEKNANQVVQWAKDENQLRAIVNAMREANFMVTIKRND